MMCSFFLMTFWTDVTDVYFCKDLMMGMVREDILPSLFEVLGQVQRIEELTHQPKVVNQNGDTNEWKRRGIF